jgi:hypothetical protein
MLRGDVLVVPVSARHAFAPPTISWTVSRNRNEIDPGDTVFL